MRITSVGVAFPPNFYDQETVRSRLEAAWATQHYNVDRLRRLHENVLVGGRHLALPIEEYEELDSFGKSNEAWIRVARQVGGAALLDALHQAGLDREQLGALFTVSVTGLAVPSLDARLMNDLQLPVRLRRVPIFGLGCLAGAAGIARAADYVRAYPDQVAALLSVELCSLTLQRQDLSIPNLIATGLFGDGAAAVLIAGDEAGVETDGPRVVATRSVFYRDTERIMGWDVSENGFQVVLSGNVPKMVEDNLRRDVDGFLADHELSIDEIESWVCHPGGPKVLEAMERALDLERSALEMTWTSLREAGNLSSSSVLLVLRDTWRERRPRPGSWGMLLAMGPGFCSELVLLRW